MGSRRLDATRRRTVSAAIDAAENTFRKASNPTLYMKMGFAQTPTSLTIS
jgi:hypothetical protein